MKTTYKLTKTQRAELKAYKASYSNKDIATFYGLTKQAIERYVTDTSGVDLDKLPPLPDPEVRGKWLEIEAEHFYSLGYSPLYIASRFGASVSAVCRILGVEDVYAETLYPQDGSIVELRDLLKHLRKYEADHGLEPKLRG